VARNSRGLQHTSLLCFALKVARVFRKGCAWLQVVRHLGGRYAANQIKDAINFLINEGHIYSTIDDFHHKSVSG
jgi:Replication protein A C terminal